MRYFDFSFDFGDPFFDFGGYRWAFRMFTPENTYGLDPAQVTLVPEADGLTLRAGGLTWAGGQQRAEGGLTVKSSRRGDVVEWQARATNARHPIKSVAALVKGVPRGQVAWYDTGFFDPGEDEQLRYYPYGGKYGSNGAIPGRWDCDWRVVLPDLTADFQDANHAVFHNTRQAWPSSQTVASDRDIYLAQTLDLLAAIREDRSAAAPIEEGCGRCTWRCAPSALPNERLRSRSNRPCSLAREAYPMPLTEYSRPRLDLAGAWQLAFDSAGEGLTAGWTSGRWPDRRSEPTRVPGPWNVTHPDAEGVGFYRKEFSIPAEWAGKAIRLHCDGASYRTEGWLNGSYLGSHEGAYTPFSFDIASAARLGAANELVMRVAGLSRTSDVDGMILQQSPASKQSWYYAYGGIWGDVYLQALPRLSCRAVRIEPDLRRERVLIEVAVENHHTRAATGDLHLRIEAPQGATAGEYTARVSAPPGVAQFAFRINLPHPLPWSCEAPNLYHLLVEVREAGGEADTR